MNTATEFTTTKGELIKSHLSDKEACDIINANPDQTNSFARSLARDYAAYGRLTTNQIPYMHKFALEMVTEKEEPQDEGALTLDLTAIWQMMDKAGETLKFPKINFELDNGRMRLHRATEQSRTPGAIMVTDGVGWSGMFYGRVHTNGTWEPSRDCPDWVTDSLKKLSEDPAGFAAAYGKKTGNCCFCSRDLSDERSLGVGYGPVCADRYGLTWGE